jgi:hypothetical protein
MLQRTSFTIYYLIFVCTICKVYEIQIKRKKSIVKRFFVFFYVFLVINRLFIQKLWTKYLEIKTLKKELLSL